MRECQKKKCFRITDVYKRQDRAYTEQDEDDEEMEL